MNSIVFQLEVFTLSFLLFFTYSSIDAEASSLGSNEISSSEDEPKITTGAFLRFLENLLQEQNDERRDLMSTKRGLDLGLSRGFSGSQAAKHLMGLAAANFAGGPGRRRRSLQSSHNITH